MADDYRYRDEYRPTYGRDDYRRDDFRRDSFSRDDRYSSREDDRYANRDDDRRVAIDETTRLISSDKVAGTRVYNPRGERLGTIRNVMIDKRSGRVDYAVMSFGGFLGMGERYHPLPWDVLRYDERHDGYVVNLDERQLERGPSFRDEPRWDDRYNRDLQNYYGVGY
jgi:hypothetical protein